MTDALVGERDLTKDAHLNEGALLTGLSASFYSQHQIGVQYNESETDRRPCRGLRRSDVVYVLPAGVHRVGETTVLVLEVPQSIAYRG